MNADLSVHGKKTEEEKCEMKAICWNQWNNEQMEPAEGKQRNEGLFSGVRGLFFPFGRKIFCLLYLRHKNVLLFSSLLVYH